MNRLTSYCLLAASLLASGHSSRGEEVRTLQIGSSAPAFSLQGIDGMNYTLESFRDSKILLVIFTANHCPTAQAYEERILQLYQDYHLQGVGFVLVSPNHPQAVCLEELGYSDLGDSFEEMKIRAKEKNFPMPYLYDGDKQEMAKAYGPTTTPHVFIFDEERKLRFCGRIDEMESPYEEATQHDTRNAIQALLEGRAVPVEKTKTFGCSIKWASKVEWRSKLDTDWKNKPVTITEVGLDSIRSILQNQGKKYLLVNVWATWCGPCVVEFPELVILQRMYGARDFEFVSLSTDGMKKKGKVLEFLKEKHAANRNYLYAGTDKYALIETVNKDWSGALPVTMLIAPGGELVYMHEGVIDPLELRQEIIKRLGRFFADD